MDKARDINHPGQGGAAALPRFAWPPEYKPRIKYCRQYVGKARDNAFISLSDKELRKNRILLLTTGSVVRTRAGEHLGRPKGRPISLRMRVRTGGRANQREEKAAGMPPAAPGGGPEARGRIPRTRGRTRAGELKRYEKPQIPQASKTLPLLTGESFCRSSCPYG
jgi:hypothetical protein